MIMTTNREHTGNHHSTPVHDTLMNTVDQVRRAKNRVRDRIELPIRRKPLQALLVAAGVTENVPTMGADIRKAMHLVIVIARQQQWLIQTAIEHRDRLHLARHFRSIRVGDELPRSGEDSFAALIEHL